MLLDAVEHILYFLSIAKPALTVTGLNSFLSICTNKESMCTNKESMCTNKEFICTNYESICTNKEYIFLAPKMGILPSTLELLKTGENLNSQLSWLLHRKSFS